MLVGNGRLSKAIADGSYADLSSRQLAVANRPNKGLSPPTPKVGFVIGNSQSQLSVPDGR